MLQAGVDTDVIIRLLTGDDVVKQQAAQRLFERVERLEIGLQLPVTVIADCLYVLTSPRLYGLEHREAVALLGVLVRLPGLKIEGKATVTKAMELFADTKIDFGDAMIAASLRANEVADLYSYDHDFDKVEGICRHEPV